MGMWMIHYHSLHPSVLSPRGTALRGRWGGWAWDVRGLVKPGSGSSYPVPLVNWGPADLSWNGLENVINSLYLLVPQQSSFLHTQLMDPESSVWLSEAQWRQLSLADEQTDQATNTPVRHTLLAASCLLEAFFPLLLWLLTPMVPSKHTWSRQVASEPIH